jgi:predicted FMN-binding regulatory protein PaiB
MTETKPEVQKVLDKFAQEHFHRDWEQVKDRNWDINNNRPTKFIKQMEELATLAIEMKGLDTIAKLENNILSRHYYEDSGGISAFNEASRIIDWLKKEQGQGGREREM